MEIKTYIETHKERFLNELFGLIRIPSVSAKIEHKADMESAANYWKQVLLEAGADSSNVMPTKGNPVVFAEKIISDQLPTVLVYGHYDVMPAEPFELWHSKPFEPEIRDEKIYARGADDDKGQAFMHAKAFEYLVKTNQLPCNVKFMIEGEEEVGSSSLEAFCIENKEMLKSDIILVSDTGMIAQDIPSITVGLRGLAYMQVEITGPNRDLHSGIFGGAVANPANVLAKMIGDLINEKGEITIDGFYDDVEILTPTERKKINDAPFDLEVYKKALAIEQVKGEEGFTTLERTGIRPTLDVNGMWSGYIQEGTKTVLPSKAYAKISMRLVPHQKPEKIAQLFEAHFQKHAPQSVKVKVEYLHGGDAYSSPTDSIAYLAAEKAYTQAFGKMPIPTRSGGSIPIITTFERVLGVKSILMGFGLESDAIHSPNENFPLFNFFKGIETIPYFYKYFAEMQKK
jgi:acetylornithine deacetylase/succinyl-diaminopimelate desuccinylase-like protein